MEGFMRKSTLVQIVTLIAAVFILLFVSCQEAGISGRDKDSGSLRLVIGDPASKGLGAKALTGVDTVFVTMTNEVYPQKSAIGSFGSTITIPSIRIGTWKVQVDLSDSVTNTLKYNGETYVTITAGTTTNASIAVFGVGELIGSVTEGVPPPIFTPSAINMVAMTYTLSISWPTYLTHGVSDYIKYTIGTLGAVPLDPVASDAGSISTITLTNVAFTDTIKGRLILSGGLESSVATFSYLRPYFSLAQGSYTGFQYVSLYSMQPGVTIRYTVSDAAPGAQPTYEAGTVWDGEKVVLRYPTSILKAVSYTAGQPDTVSDVTSATYYLDVAPSIQVYLAAGSPVANNYFPAYDFGAITPNQSSERAIYIGNAGNGQDLILNPNFATVTTNSTNFMIGDPTGVLRTIPMGRATAFNVSFQPGGTKGVKTGALTIYSNDPTTPSFIVNLTGKAYDAPTVTLLSGLEVTGAADTVVNGRYDRDLDRNGYAGYKLSGTTYIYYQAGWGYIVGYANGSVQSNSVTWSSINSATVDNTYAPSTNRYYKNTTTPLGLSAAWSTNGGGAKPDVTRVSGINGKDMSNDTAFAGYMTLGRTIKVYYSVTADSGGGDTVAATPASFQWYKKNPGGNNWFLISGATAETYTLTSNDIGSGTQLKVEVTSRATSGVPGLSDFSMITVP
jgi:hypothetical protein